jgi:hypothetical protein
MDLKLIAYEVKRALFSHRNEQNIDQIETRHLQVCKDVLSDYVHKRIRRTAGSIVYEFEMKWSRYERLSNIFYQNSQMNILNEDMKERSKMK